MLDEIILQWGNPALHGRTPPVETFGDLVPAQRRRLAIKELMHRAAPVELSA